MKDIAAFPQNPTRGFLQQKPPTSLPTPQDAELAGAAPRLFLEGFGQPSLGGRQIHSILHVPSLQRVAAESRVEFSDSLPQHTDCKIPCSYHRNAGVKFL